MPFELAQELKNAGFPQGWGTHLSNNSGDEHIYIPKLEELIEACGNKVDLDIKPDRTNAVQIGPVSMNLIKGTGSTPREAVARLYIALNKK